MSSSKILAAAQLVDSRVPVGSREFIDRFYKQREENSSEGQKLRQMEERHQLELQQNYRTAFAQGEAAGLQKGLARSQQLEHELRQVIANIVSYQNNIYEQARTQICELSFALADKITKARGEAEPQMVIETINRCISEFLDKTRLVIKVNPTQVEFVRKQIGEIASLHDSTAHVAVEPDPRIGLGGCIVETDSGSADARFETQLEVLKARLAELS